MFLKKIHFNLVLLFVLLIYYLFFLNKGIVLYDEGYYAHMAERIVNGEVPYRDFFLQFTPGYFYLLALFYKIFGLSLLTGRILTLIICLAIGWVILKILDKFELESKAKVVALAAIASFGFPLINNMALLAWISILLSLLAVLAFIDKKYLILGIFLSLVLFTKQNLGIYFFIATNIFLLIARTKLKDIVKVNLSFLIPTVLWFVYFFFILNGFDKFIELINFNSRYLSIYSFSYPPLIMILEPLGLIKLTPYYLPFILALLLVKEAVKKKIEPGPLYLMGICLIGFYGTVYPTSDLLHVYPFFGPLIVSSLLFFRKKTVFPVVRVFAILLVGIGLYLTLFREYYRYQPPYRYQKVPTEIPRMKNIYIDEPFAKDLSYLNLFLLINSKKSDYIICYPFCPMAYFIFERENPTRYGNFYPGYLTEKQERDVIEDIKNKKVRFIVTFLDYKFNKPISRFIQNQEMVLREGEFRIFKVR